MPKDVKKKLPFEEALKATLTDQDFMLKFSDTLGNHLKEDFEANASFYLVVRESASIELMLGDSSVHTCELSELVDWCLDREWWKEEDPKETLPACEKAAKFFHDQGRRFEILAASIRDKQK